MFASRASTRLQTGEGLVLELDEPPPVQPVPTMAILTMVAAPYFILGEAPVKAGIAVGLGILYLLLRSPRKAQPLRRLEIHPGALVAHHRGAERDAVELVPWDDVRSVRYVPPAALLVIRLRRRRTLELVLADIPPKHPESARSLCRATRNGEALVLPSPHVHEQARLLAAEITRAVEEGVARASGR